MAVIVCDLLRLRGTGNVSKSVGYNPCGIALGVCQDATTLGQPSYALRNAHGLQCHGVDHRHVSAIGEDHWIGGCHFVEFRLGG